MIVFCSFGLDPVFLLLFLSIPNTLIRLRLRLCRKLSLVMKNYRKISKKQKIKGFVLGSLVPCLAVLSIVFSSVFSVSVKANGLYNDTFVEWLVIGSASAGDSTIGTGSVQLSCGSYQFNLPFSHTFDSSYDYRIDYVDPVSGEPYYVADQRYAVLRDSYFIDYTDAVVLRILFPSNFLGKVINGVVSQTFTLRNNSNDNKPTFYKGYYVPYSHSATSYDVDFTGQWSLSSASSGGEGYNVSLTPNPSNVYYNLSVSFDNYYVPYSSAGVTRVGIVEIPLEFHYTCTYVVGATQLVNGATFPLSDSDRAPLITCAMLDVIPQSSVNYFQCSFTGAHFLLDNDYYTILHAIADQTFLQNEASDIAYLKNLLNTWLDASSSTMVPINFGDFALAVYDYLEGIQLSISDAELSDLSHYLSELVSLQEYTYDTLDALYTRLNELGLDEVESETIDGLTDDILDQVNYEHRYYGSLISSLQSNLDSVISNAPNFSSLQAPANFYIGCLQSLYTSIGSFAIVISVVLLGGVLLRIIGRIH